MGCDGVRCTFGCSGGCVIVCAATAGTATAICALGGTFGGTGASVAIGQQNAERCSIFFGYNLNWI